jgi:molybdopterin-guanine dinucleotide biosynthesis protein A
MAAGREGRLVAVSGAVLLGGASTRMGRDKARLEVAGVPLATRTAHLLASLCEEVLLVGGDPPEDARGRRVADLSGPRCALRGVASALAAATRERVLVVATDLPLLSADLLLALVAHPPADAVIPRPADGPQPLCALYRREPALVATRAALDAGRLKVLDALEGLKISWLDAGDLARVDPDGRALLNANDESDLARTREILARGSGALG